MKNKAFIVMGSHHGDGGVIIAINKVDALIKFLSQDLDIDGRNGHIELKKEIEEAKWNGDSCGDYEVRQI